MQVGNRESLVHQLLPSFRFFRSENYITDIAILFLLFRVIWNQLGVDTLVSMG